MKNLKVSALILYAFLWVISRPGNYPEESIQHSEHGESLK